MKTHYIFAFLTLIISLFVGAQDSVDKKQLTHNDILGAWELTLDDGSKRIKFMGAGQWTITQCDPNDGTVKYHHGGTYTLNGSTYIETVVYANKNTSSLIGDSHKFELAIEGDLLYQTGIGNPWTENWTRIKP